MIRAIELRKSYGNLAAVDGISFEVQRGEILGFLGPNGAGKSTTMRMLTGYIEPSSGQAMVAGFDLATEPKAAKRKIGYLPESAASYPAMTVLEYLHFCAELRGIVEPARQAAVQAAMEKTQLFSAANKTIATLSKGYRQRVGFAQALVHDPPVLILDEPTDGLDPNQKHEVRQLIRQMAQDKAILLSTHILEEAEAVCDRVLVIHRGRICASGTPAELLTRSSLYQAVEFRPLRPLSEAEQAQLKGLEGAKELVISEQPGLWRLLPQPGANLLSAVTRLLSELGQGPEEIYLLKGRMDEVFRNLTAQEAP
ncbi:MAG: ABC transporter ATP-binding protein [bacterium]|nr:ABC transporter ATP-binding protein [bacterium]